MEKITRSEIVDKFKDVKEMTPEEKEDFIKGRKQTERINIFFLAMTIFGFGTFLFWAFGFLLFFLTGDQRSVTFHVSLFMMAISFPIGFFAAYGVSKIRRLQKKIRKGTMYMVPCTVCGRQYHGKGKVEFTLEVTNNGYVLDEDIPVTSEFYDKVHPTLYLFDKTGKYYLTIGG